jgi:hypothetical protein
VKNCRECGAVLCRTCGWQVAIASGECRTCYTWRYRHGGQTRPEELIVSHALRVQTRMLLRRGAMRRGAV